MWCWRSKGSNHSGLWIANFILLSLFWGISSVNSASKSAKSQETVPHVVTLRVKVTLVGLTVYRDFQEIKAALLKSQGSEKVSLDSEAPGLITFDVAYAGEPKSLADQIQAFFPQKYKITQKQLPSGMEEINIALP